MEISSAKTYLHIGFPRTASTSLQEALWHIEDISSLGLRENFRYFNSDFEQFFTYIQQTPEGDYQPAEAEHYFQKSFGATALMEKVIVSDENLSGVSFGDSRIIAERLKVYFPSAQILIVIRNQYDLIRSYYEMAPDQPLRALKTKPLSLATWLKMARTNPDKSILPRLNFDEVITSYGRLFEHVEVVPFELLVINPNLFFSQVESFLDLESGQLATKMNKRNSGLEFHQERFLSKVPARQMWSQVTPSLLKTTFRKILNATKTTPKLTDSDRDFLYHYYRDSNRQLSSKLNLNLEELGYPI